MEASTVMITAIGCGEPKKVAVHPVSGKISVGGEAPLGAQIVLHGATAEGQKFVPAATVEKDGSFKISSYGSGDGAPEGEYTATIAWFKVTEDGARGPDVVPAKYGKKETSPIKISVKPGNNDVPPIDVPKT